MKFFKLLLLSLVLFSINIKSSDFDFILEQEIRLREYNYYQHTDFTVEYHVNKQFTPFIGYRWLYENYDESSKDDFWWNRFHTGFHYVFSEKWGTLALRSRFEYTPGESEWTSLEKDIDDDFRFRERLKYNLPYKFTKFQISPFIFEEVFIDIDSDQGLYRNRMGGGVDSKLTKHLTCALYYFLESKKGIDSWHDDNVLAMTLKYKF